MSWRDDTERAEAQRALAESEERFRLLAEHASDVVLFGRPDQTVTWVSESVREVLGWEPDDLVGTSLSDLMHPDDVESLRPFFAAVADGRVGRAEARVRTASGDYRWISARVTPIGDQRSDTGWRVAGWRDVQAEHESRDALLRAEALYRELAENASDCLLVGDERGAIVWASESVRDVLGWRPDELVGRDRAELIHPDELEALPLLAPEDFDAPQTAVGRMLTADGSYRWLSVRTSPLVTPDGDRWRIVGVRDIQREHDDREALARSEERFRMAMLAAPVGMALVDLDRRFTGVNPALCRMLGRSEEWLLAHRIPDVLDPLDNESDLRLRAGILDGHLPHASAEKRLVTADGGRLWSLHVVAPLHDSGGVPVGWVSQFLDISDAVRARERLRFKATHDALTNVGNREDLEHTFRQLAALPGAGHLGVLFIDVDRLKEINDRFGHPFGDAVLVEVAHRIQRSTRRGDVVIRYGGDEFVVVVPHVDAVEDLRAVAENIMRAMATPVGAEGSELTVTVSVGAIVGHLDEAPDELLRRADQALYLAKNTGRGRIVVV